MIKNFLFSTSFKPALRPTQSPIQWVPGDLSPGVKRQGREADHSSPASSKVKKMWIYTSTPPYAFISTGTTLPFVFRTYLFKQHMKLCKFCELYFFLGYKITKAGSRQGLEYKDTEKAIYAQTVRTLVCSLQHKYLRISCSTLLNSSHLGLHY
jgi:hypothetical protein